MEEPKMKIFCFDVSHLPRPFQFILCVIGIFLFYLLYGFYQEKIFEIPGFHPYGLYLTLVQFLFYAVFSIIERVLSKQSLQPSISIRTYNLIALLTVGTMSMSNASLGYLNYPTQVIFKCCKLIPVMIGGILIQGKVYKALDFGACIFMSIGLVFFILADSIVRPNFNILGIIMMTIALSCDAVIGNVQEKSMKASGLSNSEVVLYSYGIGFLYILAGLVLTGKFTDGFLYFYQEQSAQKYGYTFIFSITGYLGVSFVLTFIRTFGALSAVTVTTCRKAVTIIISFTMFSKPFTIQYVWSGMIVLLGILISVYQKNRESFKDLFRTYFLKNRKKILDV